MEEQFIRTQMMLGDKAMEQLSHAHVAVFGLGGVGGWCVEGLTRSGVGALTLIDHDTIGLSNINRQIQATHATIGQERSKAMAHRVLEINPNCMVTPITGKYEGETREAFLGAQYDYIIDAIDLVSCKLDLIETALSRNIPMISSLGTGNKLNPHLFRISNISQTEGCPLARIVRKELRKRNITNHTVLWSPEEPVQSAQYEAPPPGRRSVPGSVPWVPPVAGLMLAGYVVQQLAEVKI